MRIFSPFPPIPKEAILAVFRDFLVLAAGTDRAECWPVAEQVYRALRAETAAQSMSLILANAWKRHQSSEDRRTVVFEALEVVNSLGEAAEAWWRCFDQMGTARCVARDQEEADEWFTPLMQAAEEHYHRVQDLHWQAFQEILAFAQTHEVTLRIPLEQPYASRSLHQMRNAQIST
jgi:hypothetical protein